MKCSPSQCISRSKQKQLNYVKVSLRKVARPLAVRWWWLLGLDVLQVTVEMLDWWCTGSISCWRVMWIWAADIFSSEMRGWTQMCGGWWMIPVWRRSCECQQTCAHTKRKASTRTLGKCILRHDQRQEKTTCITFSCLAFSCLLILCGSFVCVYLVNDDFYMTAFWRASALKGTCFLKNVNGRGWMRVFFSKKAFAKWLFCYTQAFQCGCAHRVAVFFKGK